jgi:hypothetical protein
MQPPKPQELGAVSVRARVERSLRTRSAKKGTLAARAEEVAKIAAGKAWAAMKQRPSIGVLAAGSLGLVLASTLGVGELAIGLAVGYAAFQILAEGVPPSEAARHAAEEIGKLAD